MANRNTPAAVAAVATVKVAPALRAAAAVGKHGIAAMPRLAAATGTAAASAKRYGNGAALLTPAFASATFTLTAMGKAAHGCGGAIGRNGAVTLMGLTAVALGNAGGTATGAQVVAAMLGNPQLVAAMLGTKAAGVHVNAATATSAKLAQGYVNGLCRAAHGLARKA